MGLIFLRYISFAFEKRYNQLVAEGDGFKDDKDAYIEENIFFVPEKARWSKIEENTRLAAIWDAKLFHFNLLKVSSSQTS